MPFGIIMSLVICTVLYIALSAVMTGMAPWRNLGTAEPMITALAFADGPPKLLAVSRFIIALGAVIAMGSVLLVFQLGQPRIFFSMARDGLLPPFLAKVHPRFRTPWVGTIITGVFVASFAAFANIAEVVDLTNIGTLFAFILVSLGVIVLRYKEPDRVRPFRVPWVPVTPLISVAACIYLAINLPKITWIRFAHLAGAGAGDLLPLRVHPQPAAAGPGKDSRQLTVLLARVEGAAGKRNAARNRGIWRSWSVSFHGRQGRPSGSGVRHPLRQVQGAELRFDHRLDDPDPGLFL